MFSLDSLRDLFHHMDWADGTVWKAMLGTPAAEGDEKLRKLLHHIHNVQQLFLQVWKEVPLTFTKPSSFTNLAAMEQWTRPYYPEAHEFLARLTTTDLEKRIIMPWVPEFEKRQGVTFATPTLAETIFQVTSHSTYHRGQVNVRLREVGGNPPLVDFIAWVWLGKPTP